MFYKKKGFPEDSELVICTVKQVQHNSVFVSLDEYQNKEGLIHISEISPGRIRTVHDFVRVGKQIICKVIRVNPERNHIELSLRRVSLMMRKQKLEQHHNEQNSEKILEVLSKSLNTTLPEIYKNAGYKIIENYPSLYSCFQDIVKKDEKVLLDIGVDKTISKKLTELIKQRIKPPEAKIIKTFTIKNPSSNGIDIIKNSLLKSLEFAKSKNYNLSIKYLGAPRYSFTIISQDFKTAQKMIDDIINFTTSLLKKENSEISISK